MTRLNFKCMCFQTLQSHYHPEVSKVAQRINTVVPTEETDLSELLDVTENEVSEIPYNCLSMVFA